MPNFNKAAVSLAYPKAAGVEAPTVPAAKEKRKPPMAKQMSSKISTASSKLTEVMAWTAKVQETTTLCPI